MVGEQRRNIANGTDVVLGVDVCFLCKQLLDLLYVIVSGGFVKVQFAAQH